MRFESIKVSNYRQYRDIFFEFKKSTENDIHIIIASNGVGKTNILNSVNWCLYGDEPHTSGTSNLAKDKLPLCNLQALSEAKENEEELCEVSVEIVASEEKKSFIILRKAMVNTRTKITIGKDVFQITETTESGDTTIHSSEESKEIVDRYLPKKIREYFYVDGERLLNYFNIDANKISHIRDSIYEIAQVNVVNEVEKHLKDFEKKYKKYELHPQPRIVDVKVDMNIFPEERDYNAKVKYIMVNKSNKDIDSIFVNHDRNLKTIAFNAKNNNNLFLFFIYPPFVYGKNFISQISTDFLRK